MADNVPVTAGSGTNIATDDVSAVHYQKIKLDGGGDGVSVPIVAGQQTKAASVPVVIASDQGSLAVAPTIPVNRVVSSTALGALNAAVTISADGAGDIAFEIDTGTLVGTVTAEATLDDTNWFAVETINVDGRVASAWTSFGIRGHYCRTAYSQVRLRVSAYTSGTSNARLELSAGGVVSISPSLPQRWTYRACTGRIEPGATATATTHFAMWHLATSTKTVKVRRVRVSMYKNSVAALITLNVNRITSAPTATALTPVSLDTSDPTAECSAGTLVTAGGTVSGTPIAAASANMGIIAATTAGFPVDQVIYDYQEGGDQKPLTLRKGVLEGFSVSVANSAASIVGLTVAVEFTEE